MKQVSAFITYASLGVGIVFAALLVLFMQPILGIFGANAETYALAKGYVFHISYGAPFIIWSAAASFVVRSEGSSREAMIGSMIGTVANIVLDPIMISGLHMGAAGAAIATTIGNVMASAYYLWYFVKKSPNFSILPKDFSLENRLAATICSCGLLTAIFHADESLHDHLKPDPRGIWERSCGRYRHCIQGKHVYHLPADGPRKWRTAALRLQFRLR